MGRQKSEISCQISRYLYMSGMTALKAELRRQARKVPGFLLSDQVAAEVKAKTENTARIASGSHAEVKHVQLEKEGAAVVKIVHPFSENGGFFVINEAMAFCRLKQTGVANDPRVVACHGYLEIDDRPALLLEPLEGKTLKRELERSNNAKDPMSFGTILKIFRQLVSATDFFHSQGFGHGDITPGNIFLVGQTKEQPLGNVVKLFDFGLARTIAQTFNDYGLLGKSFGIGTPLYMHKDLWGCNELRIHYETFALAAILYEMLAQKIYLEGQHDLIGYDLSLLDLGFITYNEIKTAHSPAKLTKKYGRIAPALPIEIRSLFMGLLVDGLEISKNPRTCDDIIQDIAWVEEHGSFDLAS